MVMVSWYAQRIFPMELLLKGKTINTDGYTEMLDKRKNTV